MGKIIVQYIKITFGALLYAMAIALFLEPNRLAPGGVMGIAIIISNIWKILPGAGTIALILNIPILILGIKKFGVGFIVSTIYTLVLSSVLIDVMPHLLGIGSVTSDPVLASVAGGTIYGISIGMLFRMETTTGGMDIIVKIIRQKVPHIKTGNIYIILDIAILVMAAIAFHNIETALYASIAIVISSMVMDKALYGADSATLVYIISEKRKIIASRMLQELHLGVTMVQGQGAYHHEATQILLCVMRKSSFIRVKNLIKETDPKAFMIVTSANEVFGLGFKDPYKTEI